MKKYLIEIAKDAIKEKLTGEKLIDKKALLSTHPELAKEGASFVTLHKSGRLRGCIGSLVAHRPLLKDIISNAKSAAFEDPRFEPLDAKEFDELSFEVSLLSAPEALRYHDSEDLRRKIKPNRDGVILRLGRHQATYLPQVWEQLPEFDAFFTSLCQKAGLPQNCLSLHPEIFIYHVEKIEE